MSPNPIGSPLATNLLTMFSRSPTHRLSAACAPIAAANATPASTSHIASAKLAQIGEPRNTAQHCADATPEARKLQLVPRATSQAEPQQTTDAVALLPGANRLQSATIQLEARRPGVF